MKKKFQKLVINHEKVFSKELSRIISMKKNYFQLTEDEIIKMMQTATPLVEQFYKQNLFPVTSHTWKDKLFANHHLVDDDWENFTRILLEEIFGQKIFVPFVETGSLGYNTRVIFFFLIHVEIYVANSHSCGSCNSQKILSNVAQGQSERV